MSLASASIQISAQAFASGQCSAREVASATLERIARHNPALNAFIDICASRALAEADALDKARARGVKLPALAGVPYAVKNLLDVEGLTTLAGARMLANKPPATRDAVLIERLHAAGGLLMGTTNMDALAYGFTTENTHYGVTRNPRDRARSAGGSSGGSAAAVAAGLVPFALASDTNGSIRVPASLCGVFGLKPTYGRLPRTGSFPFVDSFDHLGVVGASVDDLAMAYDAMQGADAHDPVCAPRAMEPVRASLPRGIEKLRVARLSGYFDSNAGPEARWAADAVARALGASEEIEIEGTAAARAAAFVITSAEGGQLHLDALRTHLPDFEPLSRDRLLAGTLVPAAWVQRAQQYRRLYLQRALAMFAQYDLLIAPATPVRAPLFGQETIEIGTQSLTTGPNLGLLTQPISFIGLPVAVAPLWPDQGLPIGVQLIAAPWREDLCLRAAWALQQQGLASSRLSEAYL